VVVFASVAEQHLVEMRCDLQTPVDEFEAATEPHRLELRVHCYRFGVVWQRQNKSATSPAARPRGIGMGVVAVMLGLQWFLTRPGRKGWTL
jgi:hypothetical protein